VFGARGERTYRSQCLVITALTTGTFRAALWESLATLKKRALANQPPGVRNMSVPVRHVRRCR